MANARIARQGEVITHMEEMNAEESSTNEPHERTSIFVGTVFFLSRLGIEPETSGNNDIAMTTTPSAQGHYKNGSLVALAHLNMARQGEVIPQMG